jgi:Cdc6-like AAA superfamily ATPase
MNYNKYYNKLVEKFNELNIGPKIKHQNDKYYINVLAGNVEINFVVISERSQSYGNGTGIAVEIILQDDNKFKYDFDKLKSFQDEIETKLKLGNNLIWQNAENTRSQNRCRIYTKKECNIEDQSKWDEYIDWHIENMIKFLNTFPNYIDEIEIDLKKGENKVIKIKIGEFIKEHLENIAKYCENNPIELENLEKNNYSKKIGLTANFPFICKTATANSKRYWGKEYYINGNSYKFCSQFGGSQIDASGKTRSQKEGELFLKYLIEKNLLLNKYKDKKIKFIVGDIETKNDPVPPVHPIKVNNIKNILLYGPPGVGKTHNINKMISLIESDDSIFEIFQKIQQNEKYKMEEFEEDLKNRIKFVTFHQSFAYEDFIEGFRPNEEGNIELQSGIFKQICEEANENREKKFYLVIDEINRGNISKIFGELITLIEEDKRDKIEVVLPYSKEKFKVPSNLYIIGTMNSSDKSIALIDVALRRRFTFLKMKPNYELLNGEQREILKDLNEFIEEYLGEDYLIGHSYFMNTDNLKFVLDYKIIPLLEEYFYGDEEKLSEVKEIILQNK